VQRRRTPTRLAAALVAVLLAGGCAVGPKAPDDGRVRVVAAFYPLQFISERIGGDRVAVTNLTRAGAEPHDLELQPSQLAGIEDADLVVYLRGFQPAVDDAIVLQERARTFDVAGVEPLRAAPTGEHGGEVGGDPDDEGDGRDPHVWLDPVRLAAIADRLADRLAGADAANAAAIRQRAGVLRGDLDGLDREFDAGLRRCARRDVVTGHAAFGYLAARYHLVQVPITGVNPEEEPSPQRVGEVARLARERGVTTIFFESLVSPKLSETLAREIGAKAAVLDPIEGVEGDDTYFSVMRANLAALREALGCD
jgi:zinc transport system substrate-binding protein